MLTARLSDGKFEHNIGIENQLWSQNFKQSRRHSLPKTTDFTQEFLN
jgi:hypothetical protein